MAKALWTWDELIAGCGAQADGSTDNEITGVSIDSRTLQPGDLFVALKSVRDGHEFVPAAFSAGAAGALVSFGYERKPEDGPLLRVNDPLEGLQKIAQAARTRTSARVIAVTGSAGKTGTKEALRACLSRLGQTHAAEKSYNNHWGVPLTLARMPADAEYAVLEIGMNHRGEIAPLARLVRPHIAIITTIEPVHLGYLGSLKAIAEEKSDVFLGLEPDGVAIIRRDSPQFPIMEAAAKRQAARVLTFGRSAEADVRLIAVEPNATGSTVMVDALGRRLSYELGTPGAHIAENSLAVVAALLALDADLDKALTALAGVTPPPGRGARTILKIDGGEFLLIDESYNANPASMRAALLTLGTVPRDRYPRRIAVLGDMLELGPSARELHIGLRDAIDEAGVDLIFACGPNMEHLFTILEPDRRAAWAPSSEGLMDQLLDAVRPGDAVMIKGSLGSRMALLVEALKGRFSA
jgi:UDP-N-acetylmuramoyl-tripeptide--D-alanyl-D-alanine ligase